MRTQWRTPSSWRRGKGIPHRRCGPEGQRGITDAAWLGPKGGPCKANIPVSENLLQVEKRTEP